MKTSELTGPLLDYWVARAEGFECGVGPASNAPGKVCGVKLSTGWFFPWSPSTDWAIGGPIIERERIAIVFARVRYDTDAGGEWDAYVGADYSGPDGQVMSKHDTVHGPTMLITAMRAYVASKFGEVLPDEATSAPAPGLGAEQMTVGHMQAGNLRIGKKEAPDE